MIIRRQLGQRLSETFAARFLSSIITISIMTIWQKVMSQLDLDSRLHLTDIQDS